MRKTLPLSIMLVLLLAGCFRDASQERDNPTSIPLNEFIEASPEGISPSPSLASTKTLVPTLTSTPLQEPTNTFPVGGPPIEAETEETLGLDLGGATPTNSLPPTLPIPSFTPRASGSTFGDSGITPTPALPTQPVPDGLITPTDFVNLECIHVVQAGETLFGIATSEGTTPEEMLAVNPELAANPNALQIGQFLAIPNCVEGQGVVPPQTFGDAPDPTSGDTTTPTNPSGGNTYTVQAGDSLFRIAFSNNLTIDELVAANPDLASADSLIYPGQVLIIPTPSQ